MPPSRAKHYHHQSKAPQFPISRNISCGRSSQTLSPPPSPALSEGKTHGRKRAASMDILGNSGSQNITGSAKAKSVNQISQARQNNLRPGVLPTPVKTPRKRELQPDPHFKSASRVLFRNQQNDSDNAMPKAPKLRKGRKDPAISLDSFQEERDKGAGEVDIFTDSNERIPEVDESADNPFIIKEEAPPAQSNTLEQPTLKRSKYGLGTRVDHAVDNDEGMIYVFRGRKVYRKFSDSQYPGSLRKSNELAEEQALLRHQAGPEARRPLTRSAIKPRKLFSQQTPQNDEDIDVDKDTTALEREDTGGGQQEPLGDEQEFAEAKARPATEMITAQNDRAANPKTLHEEDQADSSLPESAPSVSDPLKRAKRRPKSSPFDSWPRTKPGVRGTSTKRHGEPIEQMDGAAGKRSRSTQSSQNTQSSQT
ncbi:MAG: hypothetical protein M1831_006131 [Alyxoria varia]|nr:MAG: hypothetical protein M1831_006131 [Alyxoria varia]